MRHSLRLLTGLLLCGVLALVGLSPARASHILGGQITYRYVSGDTYEVTLTLYRDCGGAGLPTNTVSVTARQACNATAVSASLALVPGSQLSGTAYCPSIQALATCNTSQSTYPNYEKIDYRGTIVLPPAATWIISYDDAALAPTGNLAGQPSFRFEATLNNLITVNGVPTRANNSSPEFSPRNVLVPFAAVNRQNTLRLTASAEADGDSLVYSLEQPLTSCGVNTAYAPRYNAPPCASGALPNPWPGTVCFLNCGATQTPNYSATLPLPVASDTVGVCGTVAGTVYYRSLRPRFILNPFNGQVSYMPNVYRPGSAALGYNKYVVVGKITEYRRLPGSNRRYLVGSVRRDFMVIVFDGAGNTEPIDPVVTGAPGGVNLGDTTLFTIRTCSYTPVRLRFVDPDNITTPTHPAASPLQNLTVTYTGPGTLQANPLQNGDIGTYQLLGNGTPNPEIRFYFQPGATYAGQTVYIPLRVEDDGCPLKGVRDRIIAVRIITGNYLVIQAGASSTPASQTTICAGETLTLSGQVLRPDSVRQVATSTTVAQVYAYQWRTLATGNLPLLTGNATITVSPTQTTRYYLQALPTLGFAQSTCSDTTSVLVRVLPRPNAPTVNLVGNTLMSSVPTGNQWFRNSTAIAGATGQSLVPSTPGSYTVTTNLGTGPTQCSSAPSAPTLVATAARAAAAGTSLHLAPNPTPDGRVQVELRGYRQPTTLTLLDVLGRTVHTASLAAPDAAGTSYGLDLSQLPAGVYVLRVSTVGGTDVCRIVRE